jgi:hypothetical protein
MRSRKALRAAASKARDPRRVDWLGGEVGSEATSKDFVFQGLAVHDGHVCIGYRLPRGRQGIEAFDANDKSLGTFSDQRSAADGVSRAVGSVGRAMTGDLIPLGGRWQIFGEARRELAVATTVAEVKPIVTMAAAIVGPAKSAASRELQAEAEILRLEAERRLGELIAEQRETIGLNKGGGDQRSDHRDSKKPGGPPTLTEAGIGKNLAHRARTAEKMSDAEFEQAKEAKRDAVLARKLKPVGHSTSRKRKLRFDAQHYAYIIGEKVTGLVALLDEYPDGLEAVLDRLRGNTELIENLAELARHARAIVAAVTGRKHRAIELRSCGTSPSSNSASANLKI